MCADTFRGGGWHAPGKVTRESAGRGRSLSRARSPTLAQKPRVTQRALHGNRRESKESSWKGPSGLEDGFLDTTKEVQLIDFHEGQKLF